MRASEHLRDLSVKHWIAAYRQAPIHALPTGTSNEWRIQGYRQRDYAFIDEFIRPLSSAIAHALSFADGAPAAQFLAMISGPENIYFLGRFVTLDCSPEASPQPKTPAFQGSIRDAPRSGKYDLMLSVLNVPGKPST